MFNFLLTQNSTPIIGWCANLLGRVMQVLYLLFDKGLDIRNIGLCIIIFTLIVKLLMIPLTIKQQKFSKLSALMNPELQAIQKKYPKRTVRVFTGDVSPKNKQEAIDAYWENADCILIATVSALKEGANLQAGNEVVFLERSDLPGENAQAIARVKRRGQTRPVTVTDIYAVKSPDTVTSEAAQVRALDIRQAIRSWLSED